MEVFEFFHEPVFLKLAVETLKINPEGTYVDATVGGAGHALQIARKLKSGKLIGFDRDLEAFLVAKEKLSQNNATVVNDNFSNMEGCLKKLGIEKVDGVLMDLGVSSFQLDCARRGFSYKEDGPLDMRMGNGEISAKDVVNNFSEGELKHILKNYGEERYANLIIKKILKERLKKQIETTFELAEIIKSSVPAKAKREKNPCKRTFQAIRIFVNDEISNLKKGLNSAFKLLKPGGRLVVITFHSIEDRVVKTYFKNLCAECFCPPKTPICVCNKKKEANLIFKKAKKPSELEISKNRRCKSAKLRAIEKI